MDLRHDVDLCWRPRIPHVSAAMDELQVRLIRTCQQPLHIAAGSVRPSRGDSVLDVVDLSQELAIGTHELGDLVLVEPGSSVYLATLDDEALG